MIKIIKNIKVYNPEYIGVKDILILDSRIACIEDTISSFDNCSVPVDTFDGTGMLAFPGFIDAHVHILGGGGEGGYHTRTPEIQLTDAILGGVTTLVGCLGTDGVSRSMTALLAKAKALDYEGISTYIYSGSYRLPIVTLTGDVMTDLMVIDKVIGAGEIALADHRSSNPTDAEVKKLAGDVRVGAMLAGKGGIINCHMGDGADRLDVIRRIVKDSEIPITQFLPTHINRNASLFEDGIAYAKAGGYIDFTTSSHPVFWENGSIKASKALRSAIENGVLASHITLTSDGQGSLPIFNADKICVGLEVGKVTTLFQEVRDAIQVEGVDISIALQTITSTPAAILKLEGKGRLAVGYDGDVVIVQQQDLVIDSVISRGKYLMRNKQLMARGTFETSGN